MICSWKLSIKDPRSSLTYFGTYTTLVRIQRPDLAAQTHLFLDLVQMPRHVGLVRLAKPRVRNMAARPQIHGVQQPGEQGPQEVPRLAHLRVGSDAVAEPAERGHAAGPDEVGVSLPGELLVRLVGDAEDLEVPARILGVPLAQGFRDMGVAGVDEGEFQPADVSQLTNFACMTFGDLLSLGRFLLRVIAFGCLDVRLELAHLLPRDPLALAAELGGCLLGIDVLDSVSWERGIKRYIRHDVPRLRCRRRQD